MSKPILYSYFRSSCSYRVRIALYLKEIDFEYRAVHLLKEGGEQKKETYLKHNPKGEVPFFIHEDFAVAQSMAILHYMDSVWQMPSLFPKDVKKYSICLELCELINAGIQPLQNLKVLQYLQKELGVDEKNKDKWNAFWVSEGLFALEKRLQLFQGRFSLGDDVSAVDLFLVPQVYNARRFNVDIDQFPRIKSIEEYCLTLEAFQKALPENQPDAPVV
ncbi:MAG: maleylacetoacetate isomerase [Bacteriovoracaceae bacterium]|nr:maleylacetoacetate isomerase [Bacteriovoracaceae bacterium]